MSPAGLPPYGEPVDLAVRGDGAVLVLGEAVWRIVDGRVTATVPTAGSILGAPAGELRRFAELDGNALRLRSVDDPAPLRAWQMPQVGDG